MLKSTKYISGFNLSYHNRKNRVKNYRKNFHEEKCEKIALILLKKFLHIVSEVGKARDGNLGDGTY